LIHQGIPKISDFGAGKEIGFTTSHKNGVMGAICYLDPKRCRDQKFNENYKLQKPSDIYSLGVIYWQIFSGRNPFENEERTMNLFESISNGRRETPVNGTPKIFIQLYETCWHSVPETRLTINEVVKRNKEIMGNDHIDYGSVFYLNFLYKHILTLYFAILVVKLVSDQCRREFNDKYPANCLPHDHIVSRDIIGVRAHFDNAENVDKQFNTDER